MSLVLIVGDHVDPQDTIEESLAKAGHEVLVAPNARVARDLLRRFPVDLILVDDELAAEGPASLAADARRREVPMLATTAFDTSMPLSEAALRASYPSPFLSDQSRQIMMR